MLAVDSERSRPVPRPARVGSSRLWKEPPTVRGELWSRRGNERCVPGLGCSGGIVRERWYVLRSQVNATVALHITMYNRMCMATNLAIDDKLLELAREIGGHRTKKATVVEARQECIQRSQQAKIVELFGTIDYDPRYDYKKLRRRG